MNDKTSIAETNARATARGRFQQWLHKRYQRLDLVEIADEPDPISLRQIFVPVQAAEQDIHDEYMGKPNEVEQEELPGQAVWNLLAQQDFMALSGRPGSGKTILVQAIVVELCGRHQSPLRQQLLTKVQRGILPLPIILRGIPDIDKLHNLDALLAVWWKNQAEQAEEDKIPLDLARLHDSFAKENYPGLILFDGIDEVGGPQTRNHVLQLAREAHQQGYRVLITGRPSGYQNLSEENAQTFQVHYLLPFAWPQIKPFIQGWYALRNEWKTKQKKGVDNFLSALKDLQRPYLLTLSRRPIFLTLMALVHCTKNEMPYGRADLYRAIVDLYLHRQERHRQHKWDLEGCPMPHWPENEPRLVLGHLALLSQQKGSGLDKEKRDNSLFENSDPDVRRVIWTRTDILKAIEKQLDEGPGRFTSLEPKDSSELLNYFLFPAGLLIEPAENHIQFAHLSFQEYLCAEFLYERGDIEGLRVYLEKNLFPQLNQPGWDEVGMLLSIVRAMKTRNEGHFELLSWLNPTFVHQADLLVNALTGGELSFTPKERIAWLPVLLACALIHPDREYGEKLARVPDFNDGGKGLDLLIQLFQATDDEAAWQVLVKALQDNKEHHIPKPQQHVLNTDMQQRWNHLSTSDNSWKVKFNQSEARAHSLLRLFNESNWVVPKNKMNPIGDTTLQQTITEWLTRRLQHTPDLLWSRNKDKLPISTLTCFELDILLPQQGPLWEAVVSSLPLDAWLLQGEAVADEILFWNIFSQACALLTLYPLEPLPKRMQLALQLYQALIVGEAAAFGSGFANYSQLRSLSRSLSLSLSLEWEQEQRDLLKLILDWEQKLRYLLKRERELRDLLELELRYLLEWERELRDLLERERCRSRARSMVRSRLLSRELSRLRSLARELSRELSLSRKLSRDSRELARKLVQELSQELSRELSLYKALKKIADYFVEHEQKEAILEPFALSLEKFSYHYAAHDWFKEQAEDPDLMRSRGLRPAEPLPVELGLFDEQGLLLATQQRENWLKFQAWLENDEAILSFTFPDGLNPDEKQSLLDDLALLRQQPWSPQAAVKAILEDWPDTEPTRECSLAASEEMLLEASRRFLKEVGAVGRSLLLGGVCVVWSVRKYIDGG